MNERRVLEQRIVTLTSLLDASENVLGPAGASLSARLRDQWSAERRLLRRLLAESPGQDVRATVDLWLARTTAFVERSQEPQPGWTDRDGHRWDAIQVLALIDDTVERLDSWLLADAPLDDDNPQEH